MRRLRVYSQTLAQPMYNPIYNPSLYFIYSRLVSECKLRLNRWCGFISWSDDLFVCLFVFFPCECASPYGQLTLLQETHFWSLNCAPAQRCMTWLTCFWLLFCVVWGMCVPAVLNAFTAETPKYLIARFPLKQKGKKNVYSKEEESN